MRTLLAIVASTAILGWTGMAQADPISPCSLDIAAKVTGTTGCELGTTNNDTLNPSQVNLDLMFGFDDWMFAQKDDDLDLAGVDETYFDMGLSLTGGTKNGTWSINNIWSEATEVMLVFKGGDDANPNTYVGYLLSNGIITGAYESPFTKLKNGEIKLKGISHVTAYVRGVTIPEPGTFALLGLGLAIMGFASRKKRV
jgi:hypothetical protein